MGLWLQNQLKLNHEGSRFFSGLVALSAAAVEELEAHRDRQLEFLGDDDHIFCRSDGCPEDPDMVTQRSKVYARKAGAPRLRLHNLRSTHAPLFLDSGGQIKVISERMGHSTIGITADLYSHVQPSAGRQAVEVLGRCVERGSRWLNAESNGKGGLGGVETP